MDSAHVTLEDSSLYGEQAINKNQYLTFILSGEEYAVDILRVQEIKGWDNITPIPNAPVYVKGVINIRGTIVPIVDLRQKFGLQQLDYGPATVMIVLKVNCENNYRTMGIIVDAVSDVYAINSEQIRSAPDLGDITCGDFLTGLATVNDKMIIILDIDRLLNVNDNDIVAPVSDTSAAEIPGLDVEVLERSFEQISGQGETLVARFYEELFSRSPGTKALFKDVSMEEQQKKLVAAIKLVISSVRDPEALKQTLHTLGQRHKEYGATPEHYQAVVATLMDVLKETSGPSWSDATYQAWNSALQIVTQTMMNGQGR
jgi:purine-binding chemotaxis protein CheW